MFQRCTALNSISLGKKVKTVGRNAFLGCSNLTYVNVSGSVTSIGYCAFEETAWMEAQKEEFVILGDGVLVKYNGEAQNVVVPDKVKYISDAFSSLGLTYVK